MSNFKVDNEGRTILVPPNRNMWHRSCPKCGKLMSYDYRATRDRANRAGNTCQSCSVKASWAKRRALKAANIEKEEGNS